MPDRFCISCLSLVYFTASRPFTAPAPSLSLSCVTHSFCICCSERDSAATVHLKIEGGVVQTWSQLDPSLAKTAGDDALAGKQEISRCYVTCVPELWTCHEVALTS
ncbi:hypothetical protein GOODEAATRI_029146 [Goodea atripinnis]|uniref:Secreted protein n=1 Tax=Goodea atripinnis TaxID=208336 RepID=A0ABV0MW44_9TELE